MPPLETFTQKQPQRLSPAFTSAAVLFNTLTEPHADRMSSEVPNILIPASHVEQGGVGFRMTMTQWEDSLVYILPGQRASLTWRLFARRAALDAGVG